jgi:predicted GNAT superfamily acetyltransferase
MKNRFALRILNTHLEMMALEELQRNVWPGNETDIVPAHLMITAAHHGGIAIGAYDLGEGAKEEAEFIPSGVDVPANTPMVGFIFGFVGLYFTPDGPRPKHCSHMLGVHPDYRDQGLGFRLKRAQWQMIRHQGLDLATWTYDPLLSLNAHLNITRLGAVCNTYLREAYGEMRDALNIGLPSDRFQVDWWINTRRVEHRLSKHPRGQLKLANFLEAGSPIVNSTYIDQVALPHPPAETETENNIDQYTTTNPISILLVEIPADFMKLKAIDPALALEWRLYTRNAFETLFDRKYIVTDTVYLPGKYPRSFYVLSHGESTL